MSDADLASIYDVETRTLNQAVKRNIERFPEDFLFQLNAKEKSEVITNCDHLNQLKFAKSMPFVFTEHGVDKVHKKRVHHINIDVALLWNSA